MRRTSFSYFLLQMLNVLYYLAELIDEVILSLTRTDYIEQTSQFKMFIHNWRQTGPLPLCHKLYGTLHTDLCNTVFTNSLYPKKGKRMNFISSIFTNVKRFFYILTGLIFIIPIIYAIPAMVTSFILNGINKFVKPKAIKSFGSVLDLSLYYFVKIIVFIILVSGLAVLFADLLLILMSYIIFVTTSECIKLINRFLNPFNWYRHLKLIKQGYVSNNSIKLN